MYCLFEKTKIKEKEADDGRGFLKKSYMWLQFFRKLFSSRFLCRLMQKKFEKMQPSTHAPLLHLPTYLPTHLSTYLCILSTHNCTECVCWMSDISPRYRSLARPFHFRILAKICQLRNYLTMEASMAHWICLRLPSCRPGFDSQVPRYKIYTFFNLYLNCDEKRAKLNLKRPGLGHIFLTWITTFF